MVYRTLICLSLIIPSLTSPAVLLHKDPEAIISGTHDFFWPFLNEENVAIVRNYPEWRDEILCHFAQRIETYATDVSEYMKNIDAALMVKAQNQLKKEYQQFMITLGDPIMINLEEAQQALLKAQAYFGDTASNPMLKERHVNKEIDSAEKNIQEIQKTLRVSQTPKQIVSAKDHKGLTEEERAKLNSLLKQTKIELFGPSWNELSACDKELGLCGMQRPTHNDFRHRAQIEDMYAFINQELALFSSYPKLSRKDKALIAKTAAHVEDKYHETLDSEGLKTAALMSNS